MPVVGATIFACAALSACDAQVEPTPSQNTTDPRDAGADPEDESGAAPGTLDRTKLGAACTNSDACDAGNCYEFGTIEPPIEGGTCVDVANGCDVLTCASGYTCRATGGDPSEIVCTKPK